MTALNLGGVRLEECIDLFDKPPVNRIVMRLYSPEGCLTRINLTKSQALELAAQSLAAAKYLTQGTNDDQPRS